MHVCQVEKGLIVVILYRVSVAGLDHFPELSFLHLLVRVGRVRESSGIFGKPRCSNSCSTHTVAYLMTHFVAGRQPPGLQLSHLSLEAYSVSLDQR